MFKPSPRPAQGFPCLRSIASSVPGASAGFPVEGSARLAQVRIGVFHNQPYYLRYYVPTLEALLARGHRLLLTRPDLYDDVWVPGSMRKRREVTTALYPNLRADGL